MSDHATRSHHRSLGAVALAALALACAGAGVGPDADTPLTLVDHLELERFAGRWYVIASRGTSAEEGAHDAVEEYVLRDDGTIDITFSFAADAFDGPREELHMIGWLPDPEQPAEWRVRPFWPLRLAYLVIDLAPDYSFAVVGHPSKRWVWIMARTPSMDEDVYAGIVERLREQGYDVSLIEPVPQRTAAD